VFYMEEENISVFVEYFGGSPNIKVLDFLIDGQEFDYSMTEVARGSNVGWSAFTKVWQRMIDNNIVTPTRTIGNAKLYKLNRENPSVTKIIQLDWELTKIATEQVFSKDDGLLKAHQKSKN